MNAVVAFPAHRVARRRAPLENKLLPFVKPGELHQPINLPLTLVRVWFAMAELYLTVLEARSNARV